MDSYGSGLLAGLIAGGMLGIVGHAIWRDQQDRVELIERRIGELRGQHHPIEIVHEHSAGK